MKTVATSWAPNRPSKKPSSKLTRVSEIPRPRATHEEDVVPGKFETIEALPERIRIIAILRGLGYTYREIGRQLNVTPQAVSLMLARHRRVLAKLENSFELARLSARAVNVLGRHGVHSRQQAMHPSFLESLQRERNCGRKTREEIERWVAEGAAVNRTDGKSLPSAERSALLHGQNN